MPELPEVETIRRQLQGSIVGRRIESVKIIFSKRLSPGKDSFVKKLNKVKVVSVGRRAKLVLINLSNSNTLVVHLKMTGKLLLQKKINCQFGRHTHVIFYLSGGLILSFEDVRKFGFLKIYRTNDLEQLIFEPAGYGQEPLSKNFSLDQFVECLNKHRKSTIKPLLLSQKCVVGVGNIYSDEVLWRSGIKPKRTVGSLQLKEIELLYKNIHDVLNQAIELGGTSVDNYRDTQNLPGAFGSKLEVYGKTGLICSRCGNAIRKIRLGGRGTHYCPRCQK